MTQPHSLTLQALSELGIIGALGLLAFAGAVLWAALKPVRGPGALSDLSLAVPCTGIFMAWLVQTNADWLHKLPGVTGLALLAAAILLTRPLVRAESSVGRSARALAVTAVLGALLVAGAVGVLWRADRYRTEAGAALKRDPVEAISRANSSIALNPDRVDIYVVKAAAYARQDDYRSARRVLAIAADKERHNYVPWALLGDLAGRRHHFEQARRAYLHASGLNPSDGSLATLARKPRLDAGVNGS